MGSTNLVTRKITASGTTDADGAAIMKYGRIHRIDTSATAGAELIIRDGALVGDDGLASDDIFQIVEEAARFAGEVIAPTNVTGDTKGCRIEDGTVHVRSGRLRLELLVQPP